MKNRITSNPSVVVLKIFWLKAIIILCRTLSYSEHQRKESEKKEIYKCQPFKRPFMSGSLHFTFTDIRQHIYFVCRLKKLSLKRKICLSKTDFKSYNDIIVSFTIPDDNSL